MGLPEGSPLHLLSGCDWRRGVLVWGGKTVMVTSQRRLRGQGSYLKIRGLTRKQNFRIYTWRFDAKWNAENTERISRYFEKPTTNTEPTWKKYRPVYRKIDTDL